MAPGTRTSSTTRLETPVQPLPAAQDALPVARDLGEHVSRARTSSPRLVSWVAVADSPCGQPRGGARSRRESASARCRRRWAARRPRSATPAGSSGRRRCPPAPWPSRGRSAAASAARTRGARRARRRTARRDRAAAEVGDEVEERFAGRTVASLGVADGAQDVLPVAGADLGRRRLDVGSVDGEAGDHLGERQVKAVLREVARPAVLLGDAVEAAAPARTARSTSRCEGSGASRGRADRRTSPRPSRRRW